MKSIQHEALDRTLTIQTMIIELLEDHPFITEDLKSKLTKIQGRLCDFYQAVGDKDD